MIALFCGYPKGWNLGYGFSLENGFQSDNISSNKTFIEMKLKSSVYEINFIVRLQSKQNLHVVTAFCGKHFLLRLGKDL